MRKSGTKKIRPLVSSVNKNDGLSNQIKYLLPPTLLIVTALVYSNGLHGGLLNFDDVEYFQNYPEVLNMTWKNICMYFSHYYVIMYQPLPVLSFALNYHFTGMDTFPIHMVNLLFHLCNIALVYILVKRLTGRFDAALIVALLFALHPMNVEAVTWISAREQRDVCLSFISSPSFFTLIILKKGCAGNLRIRAYLLHPFVVFKSSGGDAAGHLACVRLLFQSEVDLMACSARKDPLPYTVGGFRRHCHT